MWCSVTETERSPDKQNHDSEITILFVVHTIFYWERHFQHTHKGESRFTVALLTLRLV